MSRVPPASIRLTCGTLNTPFVGNSTYYFGSQIKQNLTLIATSRPLGRLLKWPTVAAKRRGLCALQPGVLPVYTQLRTQKYIGLMFAQSHHWFNAKTLSCGQNALTDLNVVQKFKCTNSSAFQKMSRANFEGEASLQLEGIKQLSLSMTKKQASWRNLSQKKNLRPWTFKALSQTLSIRPNLANLEQRFKKPAQNYAPLLRTRLNLSAAFKYAVGFGSFKGHTCWPLFSGRWHGLMHKSYFKRLQHAVKYTRPFASLARKIKTDANSRHVAFKRSSMPGSRVVRKPKHVAGSLRFLEAYGSRVITKSNLFMLFCMQQLACKTLDRNMSDLVPNMVASACLSDLNLKKRKRFYDFQYLEQIENQSLKLYRGDHLPKTAFNTRVLDSQGHQHLNIRIAQKKSKPSYARVNVSQYVRNSQTNAAPKVALDRSFNNPSGLNLFSILNGQWVSGLQQTLQIQKSLKPAVKRKRFGQTRKIFKSEAYGSLQKPAFVHGGQGMPWLIKAGLGRLKTVVVFDLKLHGQTQPQSKSLRPTLSIRL